MKGIRNLTFTLSVFFAMAAPPAHAGRLSPDDLQYLGAFRLPEGEDFTWCSGVQAYRPTGDPQGSSDGYPGSLYGIGHAWYTRAFEVGIPSPKATTNFNELPEARLLQAPVDIIDPITDSDLKGLEYLPAQPGQASDKLYVCFGKVYQYSRTPTHGYTELSLSNPNPKGPWYVGTADQVNPLNTSEYIFTIPASWAVANVAGKRLACGRHREGQQSSGPTIVAYAPWLNGNPPAPEAELDATPLLLYGNPDEHDKWMNDHCKADDWTGGAWVTDKDGDSAALIIGQKGFGDCWYGWQDGTTVEECSAMPGGCEANGYEGSNRGYWASYFRVTILFFDPEDLKKVAHGEMATWEPQPYATLDVSRDMITPDDAYRIKTGGVAYDEERGLLFITEVKAYDHRPAVHVWKIEPNVSGNTPPSSPQGLHIFEYEAGGGIGLRWNPGSDADLAGYRLYRREVTFEGIAISQYEPVTTGTLSETEFYDADADPKKYWHYTATSLDLSGMESARSSPVLYDPEHWLGLDLVAVSFPNPARISGGVQISFRLGSETESAAPPEHASMTVYDIHGRRIKLLYSGNMTPGRVRTVRWDGTDQQGRELSAGIYYYRLVTPTQSLQQSVVFLR